MYRMANVCQGLPTGPCPENRHDKSVKFTTCDLFLCPSCEKSRDEASDKPDKKGKSSKKPCKNAVSSQPGHSNLANSDFATVNKPNDAISGDIEGAAGSTNGGAELTSVDIINNELLSYVGFYRNRANIEALRDTVLTSYSPTDVSQAKRLLTTKFQLLLNSCPLIAERRNSTTRSVQEAEVDDIIGIFAALDAQGALNSILFAAVKLDNVPKYGPEEPNIAYVVERQARVESTMNDIAATVQSLSTAQRTAADLDGENTIQYNTILNTMLNPVQTLVTDLQRKFDDFNMSTNAKLDQLNAVCRISTDISNHPAGLPNQTGHQQATIDRQLNIVIFGVAEDREAPAWRSKVDDILQFVVGHPVDASDMFRLGRFNPNKSRPVLVKLRSVWDKRLILSKRSKLKSYTQRGIFVESDEPVEVRRQQTCERLKYKAEREGKCVCVNDGVLCINDVAVFSVKDGFLNNNLNG